MIVQHSFNISRAIPSATKRFGSDAVLSPGDVVPVELVAAASDGDDYPPDTYALRQIPDVGGAIVALDPHTGRVLAMSGGYDAEISQFNRATQARRQPGSSFQPFVYLAAPESGRAEGRERGGQY